MLPKKIHALSLSASFALFGARVDFANMAEKNTHTKFSYDDDDVCVKSPSWLVGIGLCAHAWVGSKMGHVHACVHVHA